MEAQLPAKFHEDRNKIATRNVRQKSDYKQTKKQKNKKTKKRTNGTKTILRKFFNFRSKNKQTEPKTILQKF